MSPQKYDWSSVAHLLGVRPDQEIADILGCSRTAVLHARRNKGTLLRRPPDRQRRAYEAHRDGLTLEEVAIKFDYANTDSARAAAYTYSRKHGLPWPVKYEDEWEDGKLFYEMFFDADPPTTWQALAEMAGYLSPLPVRRLARQHAQKNKLPWPSDWPNIDKL